GLRSRRESTLQNRHGESAARTRHVSCSSWVSMLPGAEPHEGASAADLDVVAAVLAEAVGAPDAAKTPSLLTGGLASSLLARPRCSPDIALLVRPADAPAAL